MAGRRPPSSAARSSAASTGVTPGSPASPSRSSVRSRSGTCGCGRGWPDPAGEWNWSRPSSRRAAGTCSAAPGWRVSAEPGRSAALPHPEAPPSLPETEAEFTFDGSEGFGYGRAVEWRFAAGGPDALGPADVWTRLRGEVVAEEGPTGWQRVLAVADSGNGVSAELPLDRWLFINPELTVHLVRPPTGPWVCLQARTIVSDDGLGLAQTVVSDETGRIGAGAQALLVAPR